MKILGVILLILAAAAVQGEPVQEMLETMEKAAQATKKLSPQGSSCWQCAFEEKPVCSLRDICRDYAAFPEAAKIETTVKDCEKTLQETTRQAREANQQQLLAAQKELDEAAKKFNQSAEVSKVTKELLNFSNSGSRPVDTVMDLAEMRADVQLAPEVRAAFRALAGVTPVNEFQALKKHAVGNFGSAEAAFSEAQELVGSFLESRRTPQNSSVIDNFKKRVKSLEFGMIETPGFCLMPNAVYDPQKHAVFICPQNMLWPAETLLPLLLHEIGHSIDPCVSSVPIKSNPAVKASDFPFPSTVDCLTSKEGFQARATVNRCVQRSSANQLSEAFSDWIAAQGLARKLSNGEKQPRKMLLAALAKDSFEECRSKTASTGRSGSLSCGRFKTTTEGEHKLTLHRIDRMVLLQPDIREALNCSEETKAEFCD